MKSYVDKHIRKHAESITLLLLKIKKVNHCRIFSIPINLLLSIELFGYFLLTSSNQDQTPVKSIK